MEPRGRVSGTTVPAASGSRSPVSAARPVRVEQLGHPVCVPGGEQAQTGGQFPRLVRAALGIVDVVQGLLQVAVDEQRAVRGERRAKARGTQGAGAA